MAEAGSSKSAVGIGSSRKMKDCVVARSGQSNALENGVVKDEAEGTLNKVLSSMVFENEMLLEMILRRALILPNGKLSRKGICSLRGVRRSWLRTVSDIVRKRREPLHQLILDESNSLNEASYCKEKGKLLAKFIEAVTDESSLERNIPTFSLKLEPEFFRRENHKDLSDCLVKCGTGMVSFDLTFPINSSMVLLFHSFSLPALQRLTVQFSDHRLLPSTQDVAQGEVTTLINNNHTIYPLQTILNETSHLQEFNAKQPHGPNPNLIPIGFECLNLPETLTKLLLDCPLRNSDLAILVRNDLPNLAQLRLYGAAQYDEETFHEVLKKYRTHLRILNLRGAQLFGINGYMTRYPVTLVRFPVMERLETVTISSQFWELEGDEIQWEKQLPALNELRLLQHTVPMLTKWANTHAMSPSLKRLFVSLIGNNNQGVVINPFVADNPVPLTLEIMQGIHLTMPFLTCLEITVCGDRTCALKYLFMEMRSLQKLAISLKGSPANVNPVHWDSLLIGVPMDVAIAFRRSPAFWSNVELKDNFPSIRKLTELKSLALVENFNNFNQGPVDPNSEASLISDMVFQFGFLRMPALKYLLLSGRFKTNAPMLEKWKEEKGVSIHSIQRSA